MCKIRQHQAALLAFFLSARPRTSCLEDLFRKPLSQCHQAIMISSDVMPRSSSAQPPELRHVLCAPLPRLGASHVDKTLIFVYN